MKQIIASICIIIIIAFLVDVECIQISKNLVDVIDAASSRYISSKEWRQTLDSFGIYLQTPGCSSPPQYPSTFDLPRDYLTLCYDNEAFDVWPSIYRRSGELLIQEIKQQYKRNNLTAIFKTIDTTTGYFRAMKEAVDFGICDVVLSATAITGERSSQVHFQCANGISYSGVLRSELQNDTVSIKSVTDLNNENIVVVVSDGSVFQTFAKEQLPKATIKSIPGYDDAWNMILNKTAHAFVADGLDLFVWVKYHRSSCQTCKVILYGDELRFGTFVTNQIIQVNSSPSLVFNFEYLICSLIVTLILYLI